MVNDLSDPRRVRRRELDDVRRQQSRTRAQSTSVDRGAFRIKSEEGLEVGTAEDPTGSEVVYGILKIIGELIGSGTANWEGTFNQTGTTNLRGPVNVTGENGTLTVDAETLLQGLTRVLADLLVENNGRVIVGGVTLTPLGGGRILIGTGTSQIILDTTQFKVGAAFRMDPAHSTTGAQMEFGPNRLGRIFGDDNSIVMTVMEDGSAVAALSVIESFAFTGIDVLGEMRAAQLTPLPSGEAYDLVVRSRETGKLHVHAGGTGGGPGDGIFAWPFPLDQVTSEFRSAQRPDHDGIDFGIGPSNTAGTPIPAMGAAVVHTILAEGQGHGWGNGVILDHGTDPIYNGGGHNIKTLYAHMSTPPVVGLGDAVALGQELGPIGNTGNSFGNHLHLEVWVDDVPVNPRDFMAQHGG
ncbi:MULTISPECIES: M23 family metallopeptidase [unclassified Microbacterium]|uniref:M23 family metallopeptidase n=1 Tax=Microbacterium TaxID=33882 RepID=UPI003B9FA54F